MFKKLTLLAASFYFVACIPQNDVDSSLLTSGKDLPEKFLKLKTTQYQISEKDFQDFDIGEVDKSKSFPRSYIALPKHETFMGEVVTMQFYLESDNDDKTGYVAQFDGEKWIDIRGQETNKITLRLLGKKNPRLVIDEIHAKAFSTKTTTIKLGPGTVVNPFIGLTVTKYDPTQLPWVKDFNDKDGKLYTLQVTISQKDERVPLRRYSIRQERVNGEFVAPSPEFLLVTNHDMKDVSVRLHAQYGDDNNRFSSGTKTYESYDSFLKETSKK